MSGLSRRPFLGTLLGAAASVRAADADLAPFDELINAFLKEHASPGAELAVTKDSRLVYARGFGVAEHGGTEAVAPTALFRIASISKSRSRPPRSFSWLSAGGSRSRRAFATSSNCPRRPTRGGSA